MWLLDCTPLRSTWKEKHLQRLLILLKFTDRKFACGCVTGSRMGLTGFLKGIGLGVLPVCPNSNVKNSVTSWTAVLWPTDLPVVFGPVLWSLELLKKNFRFPIIRLMFPVFSMNLNSLSSVPRRYWPVQIRRFNPNGSVINIPLSKKSQKRESIYPIRRRSQFPTGPYAPSNMGQGRLSTGNPNDGAKKHFKNLWHHRIILRSFSLSLSGCLQRPNIYRLFGENITRLLSTKDLPYSRQRLLSQRQGCLGLVSGAPQISRSLQSPGLLTKPQCFGENLVSYTTQWHTQSLFCESKRTSFCPDFYLSQHPEKSFTSSGLSTSVSMN